MFWNPAYVHLSKKAHCTVLISIGVPNDKMYTVNWQALFTPDPAGIFYNDVPGPCKIRDFLIVFSETPFHRLPEYRHEFPVDRGRSS